MMPHQWLQGWSRADFLKSAGLYVTSDHLFLVRVRKDLLRLTVVQEQARELATDGNPSSRRQVLSEAFRSLLSHFNPARDPLYLCLSADQTICIELFLPLVAQENLRQALDYEIERQLPLRPDEVYYDFLPAGQKGEKLRVFLFAIPKKPLDDLFDVLAAFGVRPKGVETTFTALSNYFLSCSNGEGSSAAIIGGQKRGWEVAELRPGKESWNPKPELLLARWFSQAEWSQGAARELFYTSSRGSPRWFGWGDFSDFLRLVEVDSLEVADLTSLGRKRFSGEWKLAHPFSLPAIGAALRGVRETNLPVNLLPEAHQEKRGNAFSRLNAALSVLLLVAVIAWGLSYPVRDELRLRQLQRENRKLEPTVETLRREEGELERIRGELTMLSRLQDRRGELLQILDELSGIVPTNAYLSAFRYRDGAVELQGSAESASNLIPALERSPLLKDVGFNAPSNRGRDNRETFSLKAGLERRQKEAAKP